MQLRNMELVELSVALQNFCGSYKAIKVAIVKNVDEMEKIALQIARGKQHCKKHNVLRNSYKI